MFKQTADIQTADMLKLLVPKANYHNVVLKPSAYQVEMVKDLSERAERVRNRMVDSSVDNMLLITNDGRKLALDQRLMNLCCQTMRMAKSVPVQRMYLKSGRKLRNRNQHKWCSATCQRRITMEISMSMMHSG